MRQIHTTRALIDRMIGEKKQGHLGGENLARKALVMQRAKETISQIMDRLTPAQQRFVVNALKDAAERKRGTEND